MYKKGAMFGLDARIALAIFGALSVISGAALYSAIQDSKVTALVTEMSEFGKAWEAYYIDTGKNLAQYSTTTSSDDFYRLKTAQLVSNTDNIANWKGPYVSYEIESYFLKTKYHQAHIHILNNEETWGAPDSYWAPNGRCTSGKSCSVWALFTGIESQSIVEAMDEKIDGAVGAKKGKFRWYVAGGAPNYHVLMLQLAPIANPHG